MREASYSIHTSIHVAQIAEYVRFDERIRANQGMAGITTVPLGYVDFSFRWNDYAFPGDARRFSAVYLADEPEDTTVQISTCPVQLHEFFITPAQVGLEDPNTANNSSLDARQADITQEFTALMLDKQRKQRLRYEERQRKRLRAFDAPPKVPGSGRHNRDRTASPRPRRNNNHTELIPERVPTPVPSSSRDHDDDMPADPEATPIQEETTVPNTTTPMEVLA